MTTDIELMPAKRKEGVRIRLIFCIAKVKMRAVSESEMTNSMAKNEMMYSHADTLLSEKRFSLLSGSFSKLSLARSERV